MMRAVCIARHRFLSEHIGAIFSEIGVESRVVVGFDDGMSATREEQPLLVVCEYDLLASAPLAEWERDPLLSGIPIIAVSLSRRPQEVHLMDRNGIAGFLYLPSVTEASLARLVQAASERRVQPPPDAYRWPPATIPVAE